MNLKKLTSYLIAAVLLSSVIVSCTQKAPQETAESGVEYYRFIQFSETPFDTEKGTHQLTEKEAQTINNYKFTSDKEGRLSSVEYCRGDEILSYGSMRGAAKMEYTYEGNKQIKHFYNKEGEQIESGGVFSAVYTSDDKGFRTSLEFLDKEGNQVENRNKINRYTWTRLENGYIKELRYNLANEETIMNPFCPFFELRFEYDSKGYVTKMMNYEADTLYNCTAENCGDIGVSYFEFVNNDMGDLLSFSVHNTVGQLSNLYWGWAKRQNKVDANGYTIETAMFDQDDEYLSGKSVPVTQNSYDVHGALIETRSLDKDRNLINNPNNGVAITEFKYDEKGNRTETLKFDKEKVAVAND